MKNAYTYASGKNGEFFSTFIKDRHNDLPSTEAHAIEFA